MIYFGYNMERSTIALFTIFLLEVVVEGQFATLQVREIQNVCTRIVTAFLSDKVTVAVDNVRKTSETSSFYRHGCKIGILPNLKTQTANLGENFQFS